MPSAAALLLPADPACQQAEDALYYRRVLHELIDMGADLARSVHKQATAEEGAAGPDAAAAFDRLAHTVRRTVALARKVAEPLPVRTDAGQQRAAARRRIVRAVEDAIGREAEGADVEVLESQLHERLDAPDLDDEIEGRPTAEVIADICHDLGLGTLLGNHPWKRRTPADVAALCERAARPPGSQRSADQHSAEQPGADQPPAAPKACATWAGPKPYSREASIELMHKLLEHGPPRIRGP